MDFYPVNPLIRVILFKIFLAPWRIDALGLFLWLWIKC
jgi:hypothetical protein